MTVQRGLRLMIIIGVLAGLWLGRFIFLQESRSVAPPKNVNGTQASRDDGSGTSKKHSVPKTHKVMKVEPVEKKTMMGVFDGNMVKGRTRFERAVGADVSVIAEYQAWADPRGFPQEWADQVVKKNKIPMLTWEPWKFSETDYDQPRYRLSTIAAGKHDTYIRAWLTEARDLDRPIMVRFAHEMNGDWYPWGRHVNAPKDYVDAWRHVVDLSREVGANNITWVWSPNEVREQESLDEYYPGSDYVDWIGISGFNWGGLEPWQSWRSFSRISSATLSQVRKYEKPIVVAEIGAIENPRPGQQTRAAWITEMLAQAKNSDPPIAMLVWFNAPFYKNGKLYNWEIDDSPSSVKAMRDGLADPAFLNDLFD